MYAAKAIIIDRPTRKSRWITLLVATGMGLGAVGAALAETATTVTQAAVVRVSTLDPASRTEAERLYRDIARAADEVCGNDATRVLWRWQAQRACAADAVARAVEQVGSPVLTAVHVEAIDGAVPQRTASLDEPDGTMR